MTKWQLIETAPKDGTNILGFSYEKAASWCLDKFPKGIPTHQVIFWDKGGAEDWLTLAPAWSNFKPTHWMPLPEPPTANNN